MKGGLKGSKGSSHVAQLALQDQRFGRQVPSRPEHRDSDGSVTPPLRSSLIAAVKQQPTDRIPARPSRPPPMQLPPPPPVPPRATAKPTPSEPLEEAAAMVLESLRKQDPSLPSGWPAIVSAAYSNRADSVQWLLGLHADPNEVTNNKQSALWCAVTNQNEDLVEMLLNAKADPCHRKKSQKGVWRTIWDMATSDGAPSKILKMLRAAGAEGNGRVLSIEWSPPESWDRSPDKCLALEDRSPRSRSPPRQPGGDPQHKRLRTSEADRSSSSGADLALYKENEVMNLEEEETNSCAGVFGSSSPRVGPSKLPGASTEQDVSLGPAASLGLSASRKLAARLAFKSTYSTQLLPLDGDKLVLDFSTYQQASGPSKRSFAGLILPKLRGQDMEVERLRGKIAWKTMEVEERPPDNAPPPLARALPPWEGRFLDDADGWNCLLTDDKELSETKMEEEAAPAEIIEVKNSNSPQGEGQLPCLVGGQEENSEKPSLPALENEPAAAILDSAEDEKPPDKQPAVGSSEKPTEEESTAFKELVLALGDLPRVVEEEEKVSPPLRGTDQADEAAGSQALVTLSAPLDPAPSRPGYERTHALNDVQTGLIAELAADADRARFAAEQNAKTLMHGMVSEFAGGAKFHDPARDPKALTEQARNVFLIDVRDLQFCHEAISSHFTHGDHTGKRILGLLEDLHSGKANPGDLPPLVVIRDGKRGFRVVCGNRRLYCLKRYAAEIGKSLKVWCVVYDAKAQNTPRALVMKYILAANTKEAASVKLRI